MLKIVEFISELQSKGLKVQEHKGQIKLTGNVAILSTEDKEKLREYKGQIIDFLLNTKKAEGEKLSDIIPIEESKDYVISSSQRSLWILSQFSEMNAAYNMPSIYILEGKLNFPALEESFRCLIARHEILRTVFVANEEEEVKQVIKRADESGFVIISRDFRLKEDKTSAVKEWIDSITKLRFDLASGPLLRAELLQIGEQKWVFVNVMHHIISDGWSSEVMIRELLSFYQSCQSGNKADLEPLAIQYKDYASWQQRSLRMEKLKSQGEYWARKFQGVLPLLDLPSDKQRPLTRSFEGGRISIALNSDRINQLRLLTKNEGGTLFMGLYSLLNILLFKYTKQTDIIIGTPVAGREHGDLENQIGFYVNTLALRLEFDPRNTFLAVFRKARATTLEAYNNQGYPFQKLVDDLHLRRDASRNPLFDVMMVFQEVESAEKSVSLAGLTLSPYLEPTQIQSKFDLVFEFTDAENEVMMHIEYSSHLFEPAAIDRLGEHFNLLMEAVLLADRNSIEELNIVTPFEKEELLLSPLLPTVESKFESIIDLIKRRAMEAPGRIAVNSNGKELNYRDLEEKSDRLASCLAITWGVQPGGVVGILLQRGEKLIVAILAVLKTGAAYVPIDSESPTDRKTYILENAGVKVLLSDQNDLVGMDNFAGTIVNVEAELNKEVILDSVKSNKPADLAYVIYTSGSTGRPKGVMVEHGGVVNNINGMVSAFGITKEDSCLQFASSAFDASVAEIFCCLTTGGTLYIVPEGVKKDVRMFESYIQQNKITVAILPPSYLRLMNIHHIRHLKTLVTAGEVADRDTAIQFFAVGTYINAYGPTEASICATTFKLTQEEQNSLQGNSLPIGLPLPNVKVYILDESQRLIPKGIFGEICIGGKGVARGYIGNEELTASKFKQNPFQSGERIYLTGDLGRLREDGSLEYLGRQDDQVKIYGYRIELGEIEAVLRSFPGIELAAAMVHEKEESKSLVAYIKIKGNVEAEAIRSFLAAHLPFYMIPSHFEVLAQFPITSNGKIDRKNLPAIRDLQSNSENEFVAPRNTVEERLVQTWEGVLGRKNIGVKDNYFELGGDSIKSIQISSRMRTLGYSLNPTDLFKYPLLESAAKHIENLKLISDQSIAFGRISLSPIHQYFLKQVSTDLHHFNQSVLLSSDKRLNEEIIAKVFAEIISHHDALRLTYRKEDENWIQEYKSPSEFNIKPVVFDFLDKECNEELLTNDLSDFQASLNLSSGPLFKIALLRLAEEDRLLIVAHHFIIDGVSWRILFEDLQTLLLQAKQNLSFSLPPKSDSYKLWMEKLSEYSTSKLLTEESIYWKEQESRQSDLIPYRDAKAANKVKDSQTISFLVLPDEVNLLKDYGTRFLSTDLQSLLLSALSMALKDSFSLEFVRINLEGHGREDLGTNVDINRTIGWFTSVFPFILKGSDHADVIQQVIETKESLLKIPRKGIGYGILNYLNSNSHTEIVTPQILFNYLGEFGSGIEQIEEEAVLRFSSGFQGITESRNQERLSEIDIAAILLPEGLELTISYGSLLFNGEDMTLLLKAYESAIGKLITGLSLLPEKIQTPSDFTFCDLRQSDIKALKVTDGMIEDIYPLSPLQSGMYYHWLLDQKSRSYFEQVSYRMEGRLDIDTLKRSFQFIIDRHPVLRTKFTNAYGEVILQVVCENKDGDFRFEDLRTLTSTERIKRVEGYKKNDLAERFDLNNCSQIRLGVLKSSEESHELIWSFHHIIMDGWCIALLNEEFYQVCRAFMNGEQFDKSAPISYVNYIRWIGNLNHGASKDYWKKYLEGYGTLAELTKRKTNGPPGYQGAMFCKELGDSDFTALKLIGSKYGLTLNTVVQGLWGIVLSRYTNSQDVVFGSIVSGRPPELEGIEEMIGLFINTVPVRVNYETSETVLSTLIRLQSQDTEGKPFHYTQLAEIQALTTLGSRLFNHVLIFENYPVTEDVLKRGERNELFPVPDSFETVEQTNYDFDLTFRLGDKTMFFDYNFNEHVYDSVYLTQVADSFQKLILDFIKTPDQLISDLQLLDQEQVNRLLNEIGKGKYLETPSETVIEIFSLQAVQRPDETALVLENKKLSYRELDLYSNLLASQLIADFGLKAEDVVGIMLDRNEWMIVSILAVLKTGSAYVPIDPAYPLNRRKYILEDAKVKTLITQSEYLFDLDFYTGGVYAVDLQFDPSVDYPGRISIIPRAHDLAYVIYTSGSSGNPKGVMVEHGALVNTICSMQEIFGLMPGDHQLQFASCSFDASVAEIFSSLCTGGTMYLVPDDVKMDPVRFEQYILLNDINIATLPPAFLQTLNIENLTTLRTLVTAGEKANPVHVQRFTQIGEYINAYGPTETAICASAYKINKGEVNIDRSANVSIGQPLPNVQIYILDKDSGLLPFGAIGEICVGGKGLARGYIHNPTLSKTKFVLNPFVEGEQLYRTGDAGRWLPDGNLDYVGRLDNQVKVHGYRIELEEIECKLLMHPIIEQACVLMKESSDDRYLIAYLVCKQELSDLEIRKELEKEMPPYMIPASYFMLSELPLTRNGKVDRHALLSLESNGQLTRDIHVEPGNPTEFKLVQIWSEILEKRVQGVTEDFFSLGGHSLNITRLLSKIHQVFDTKLELKDLFEKATIREQASLILGSKKELYSEIPVVPVAPDYVLSSSQRRLWILSQFEGGNTAYSLSSTYLLKGELDYNAFQKAFHCLVNRHEILRTVFKEDERGEVKQIVKSIVEIGFKVEFRDSLSKVREEEESRSVKPVSMVQEFDLPKGPLIKPEVIKLSPGQHLFTYSIHHIISDGWSMDILMRELMYYYNSFHSSNLIDQEPLRIHYKDYAALQQSNLSNGVLDRQKKYWLDKLTGAVPVLDLPLDRVRPIIKTFNGERVEMKLEPELFSSFNSLCQKSGATLFMGLLAAVNALLYRYTGQTEILVGTSIAGREHAELEQQVGFYLNELALLNKFSGQDHFLSVLEGVKKSTLGAFENQAYPFDELVSDLKLRRDTSRNPLFDVMVDLQNAGSSKEVTGFHGLTVLNVEGEEPPISRFDLVFNFLQSGQSLLIGMEYNSDLFERNSVQQLLVHLVGLFQSIVDAPEKPIKNLNFLPPAEIETLLVKYNQTKVPFEDEKTIIALFEEQVARTPSRIALVYREKEMTYAELNGWVNRLAAHLLNNYSMQADTLVGLILDRSDWMIIAVLGVLKAGAAYVPLDPEYPLERKKYILEETRSDLIITQSDYVFDLDYFKGDVFAIDIQLHEAPEPDKVLTVFSKPSDLAYVIFTSGSTGRPKGVMIENRSVVNYLSNCSTLYFKEESGGNFGLFSSLSFDLTVTSIFLPLIRGRLIHIIPNSPSFSDSIKLYLNSPYNLDSVKITPSHLRILLEVEGDWSNLKTFILGGEELSFELVSLLKKRKSEVDIFNEYGPTESTVGCVVERVDCSSSKIPIGYPMGNTIIRILDSEDQLVPVGVAGEICIAGQGLARGYLHNPGLTSQRFVADPYQDGGLIYKSGDLGRWMPGGAIEYKGRVDDQVKMQGYRIELGEIENVMKEVVGIGGCTVNLFELNGEDRLAGYFEGAEEELGRLKGHLKSRLPDYMIPSVLIPLRSLPLTINGKVDKGKLPSPSENMELNEAEIIRPRNETERLIASAWSDSLGMSEARIGIDSNYFDLGGNSFSIVRMSKVLSEKFSSEISVATLFRFPSIRDLSGYIQNNESEVEPLSTDSYTGLDVMDETFNLISNGEDEQ